MQSSRGEIGEKEKQKAREETNVAQDTKRKGVSPNMLEITTNINGLKCQIHDRDYQIE